MNSCLFTPFGADYGGQEYKLHTVVTHEDGSKHRATENKCTQRITESSQVVQLDLTFADAHDCGFQWSETEYEMALSGHVRPSEARVQLINSGIHNITSY